MEFVFFRDWSESEVVKLGRELTRTVLSTPTLNEIEGKVEIFPEGNEEAGEEIERYELGSKRYEIALDVIGTLAGECRNVVKHIDKQQQNFQKSDNLQVLSILVFQILNKTNTHFRIE
jgi:hypothetical protein